MEQPPKHPILAEEAARLSGKAQLALEHALPRGIAYIVILSGAGVNTYAANVDKKATLEAAQAFTRALQNEIAGLA